jgi:colanic acid biosynthesis glycosyl transferase WcaI
LNRPLHIVLLNQAFYPDVVATAQMGKDLADALVRRGHRVTAIASRSIYGRRGAVLPSRERIDVAGAAHPIEVHRVGVNLFGKRGIAARVADFALFHVAALVKLLTLARPDVVVCYTTPPYIAIAGVACRFLRGSACVSWLMDLYPDTLVACGVMDERSLLARVLERVARFLLRHSQAVVVLGRCMRERVLAKGVAPERVRLIPVWADEEGVRAVSHEENPLRREYAPGGEFVVMYSGNLGLGHEVETILKAMLRLRDERGVRFVFVGGGKRRGAVAEFVRAHSLANVSWHEYQPRQRLGESLSAGDVHLISLLPRACGVIVPSKVYGIMAAGRPAVFVGPSRSEVSLVLAEAEAGITVEPGDDEGLAKAILALRDDPGRRRAMGDRGRAAMVGRYDRETSCRAWVELLESVALGPGKQAPVESIPSGRVPR